MRVKNEREEEKLEKSIVHSTLWCNCKLRGRKREKIKRIKSFKVETRGGKKAKKIEK